MEKYDLNNLEDNDIKELLEYEKNPSNPLEYEDVYNQIVSTLIYSTGKYTCEVVDNLNNIVYIFSTLTTPVPNIFTISLRFTENNYHLLRLDFGDNLRHTNNIGKEDEYKVYGSHAHFNAPPGKYDKKNVVPIEDISEFKNLKLIRDVFLEYINYTNYTNIVERSDTYESG